MAGIYVRIKDEWKSVRDAGQPVRALYFGYWRVATVTQVRATKTCNEFWQMECRLPGMIGHPSTKTKFKTETGAIEGANALAAEWLKLVR